MWRLIWAEVDEIDYEEEIESLLIDYGLDDYSFIASMGNLRQLYIFIQERIPGYFVCQRSDKIDTSITLTIHRK